MPPKGMCSHKVKLTGVAEVDAELLGWIREAFAQASGRDGCAFDRARGDRGEAQDTTLHDRDVGNGQMQLELVLAGVVLEEAV